MPGTSTRKRYGYVEDPTARRYIDQHGLEAWTRFYAHVKGAYGASEVYNWTIRAIETGQACPWDEASPAAAGAVAEDDPAPAGASAREPDRVAAPERHERPVPDAGARHAITVLRTVDGRPCNKVVTRAADGAIRKAMVPNSGEFIARTASAPDLAALAAVIEDVVSHPDQLLVLSVFPDAPDGEFLILPKAKLAAALGCDEHDREALAGFHDLGGPLPVCARMKGNVVHSTYLLVDRDQPEGMPDALRDLAEADHDAALDLLFPGFTTCGKVRVPSTSGAADHRRRATGDGQRPHDRPGRRPGPDRRQVGASHAAQPDHELRAGAVGRRGPARVRQARPRAQERHRRDPPPQLVAADRQLDLDPRPAGVRGHATVECQGIEVLDARAIVRLVDGPPLDLAKVVDLTADENEAVADAMQKITGVRPQIRLERRKGARGRTPVIAVLVRVHDLERTTDVELADGTWTTFGALQDGGAGKVRCQSPFRESDSEAAFFSRFGDGTGYIFDSGTGEMHLLRRDHSPTMRELLREWQVECYDPSRANAVGDAFYSESRRAWVKQNEIKLPSEVLPRLAEACDAPVDKNGEVKMYAVATQARTWLGFAFGELIQALPADDDDHAPEAARAAMAVELRHQVGALLKHMVFGEGAAAHHGRATERALGTWVHWVALAHQGSGRASARTTCRACIDGDGFRIALKPSLAGQVAKSQHPEIAAMSERSSRSAATAPASGRTTATTSSNAPTGGRVGPS